MIKIYDKFGVSVYGKHGRFFLEYKSNQFLSKGIYLELSMEEVQKIVDMQTEEELYKYLVVDLKDKMEKAI